MFCDCSLLLRENSLQQNDWQTITRFTDIQGRIMGSPGPEAWKQLWAPHTYICNIEYWPYFSSIFTVTLFA